MPTDPSRGIAPGGGKTFYVSGLDADDSSDDYEGTDPQYPLATLAAAIAKCTQRKHDYIFVQDIYQGDTAPVLINVRNMHIIALTEGNQLGGRGVFDGQAVDACFKTYGTGGSLELAGFRLGSLGEACIEIAETSWYNHIHHCAFGHFLPAQDGILAEGNIAMQSWIIDHNFFSESLTRDGIRVGTGLWSFINHNFFFVKAGIGINIDPLNTAGVGGSTPLGGILGNTFMALIGDTPAEGWAITISTTQALVAGNKAATNGQTGTNNPYLDGSSNGVATLLNGWADNFDGPALSAAPATA